MRHLAFPLLSVLLLGACSANLPVSDQAMLAEEARARSEVLADRFQKELQGMLMAAMAAEGPQGAVAVCSGIAPALAEQLSEESGARVRRTALRTRNPAAAPDATEKRIMMDWTDAPLDENGNPKRWTARQGNEYRYMRAIPTMPMCLACHGSDIAPEVAAAIREYYPEDQATGFRPGQLRGAFSIRWDEAALSRAIEAGKTGQ